MHVRATCVLRSVLPASYPARPNKLWQPKIYQRRNNLTVTKPTRPRFPDDVFSRMFPGLPPFAPQTDESREQAKNLGVIGGILDAKDTLAEGPIRLNYRAKLESEQSQQSEHDGRGDILRAVPGPRSHPRVESPAAREHQTQADHQFQYRRV